MISDLIASFDLMMQRLQALRTAVLASPLPLWLPLTPMESSMGLSARDVLADLLTDVWYRDGQDGRETRSRHGVVMIDDEMQTLIIAANEARDSFRDQVQALQKELDKTEFSEQIEQLGERHVSVRESLHFSGLSRVHLKQCYRHIPLLEHVPLRVGFSWYAHGRSIKRISKSDAQDKLLAFGEDKTHIQIQLAKLAALGSSDQLAQVQTLAPVVRANIVYADSAPRARQAMNVPLPLMIPGTTLPEFNQIALEPPAERTRQRRGDQKVSDEPWLPSIRVHLYNPGR